MACNMNTSTVKYKEKIVAISVFVILVSSGFLCFLFQEGTDNLGEFMPGLDEDVTNNEYQMPMEGLSLAEETRAEEEEYMNLFWEKGHGSMIGYENSITAADVDNDGIIEVIFGNEEGFIHVIQYSDGDYVDEWKSPLLGSQDFLGTATYGLTTGDVDNDGTIEIIVGTEFGTVYIFGYENKEIGYALEWSTQLNNHNANGLATGDIDNDGVSEIVVGTDNLIFMWSDLYVFGWDGNTYVLEWDTLLQDSFVSQAHTIAIGDVDNDGTNEFVVGLEEIKIVGSIPTGTFYIFGFDGDSYSLEWKKDDTSYWILDIGIGDIDDDGILEIVIGSGYVDIYQYQSGAYVLEDTIPELLAYIEIGDVNGDNILEILTGNFVLKVWEYDTLLWESETLPENIHGIAIDDCDGDNTNEIIIAIDHLLGKRSMILIFSSYNTIYQEEWRSEYINPIDSIAIGDTDNDPNSEIFFGTRYGELLIFEYQENDYILEHSLTLGIDEEITHIFIGNFDNAGITDIVATNEDLTIFFIQYNGADYEVTHQLDIDSGEIEVADFGDVDNDGINEIVIGNDQGTVYIIGYNGDSYIFEWQGQISNTIISAIGIGDSDIDGTPEIALGGWDQTLYVLGYDGSDYVEEWTYLTESFIDAIEIGDSDNDDQNELLISYGLYDLIVFGWDGNTYQEEWHSTDFESILDEALEINNFETNDNNNIIIGEYELYIMNYNGNYQFLWQTENFSTGIQCIFVENTDNLSSKEIVVSIGGYVFIFSREQLPVASLSASKTIVDIEEEIIFNGSASKGCTEYFFDFGDDESIGWTTVDTTMHSYSTSGTYIASLKVRYESHLESTNLAVVTITVLKPNIAPIAYIDEITPDSAIEGETVHFTGHGFDEDGTITSYSWESDIDGMLSSLDSFSSTSLSVGTHSISFKVKDDEESWSESDPATLVINSQTQNQVPTAHIDSISPNPGIEGETITFSGHGNDDGTITSYSWESDIDGLLSSESSFHTSSLSLGTHIISFKVKDDEETWSQLDTATLTIDPIPQNQAPMAYIDSVTPNPATDGETVSFVGYGVDNDGTVNSYSWESDIDGLLSSERAFSTSSMSVGEHIITFKVKDDNDVWSDGATTILVVEEKDDSGGGFFGGGDDGNNNLFIIILLVAIALVIITIIAIMAVQKNKKLNIGAMQVSCPGCSFGFDVTSPLRPQNVQCPNCGLSGVLNE